MKLTEKSFQVLDALYEHEVFSQRQLAKLSGVSLAQVNYILKRLLEKGLVKTKRFKNSPNKYDYFYLLSPKGLETKSRLAVRFVTSKLKEYNQLIDVLTKKLISLEKASPVHVIFVGPSEVKAFLDSIIKENHLKLILMGHCNKWKDLKEIDFEWVHPLFLTKLMLGSNNGLQNQRCSFPQNICGQNDSKLDVRSQ